MSATWHLRHLSGLLALFCALLFVPFARAAEIIPPAPRDHFNDYAGIVTATAARSLNRELAEFERTTSNQIVVAIFPHMQSDSSIEDYTVRVAQAWGVGTRDKKNGAVLFVFSQDRKLYIQVGYGLEGVLPDALCKQIIANEITPRFRSGDFTAGVSAGVRALLAATRGEYRGTGRTIADRRRNNGDLGAGTLALITVALILITLVRAATRRNSVYSRRGRVTPWITSGSSWGSGSSGGGGGGSFSGGSGSFGGGGAGGSW